MEGRNSEAGKNAAGNRSAGEKRTKNEKENENDSADTPTRRYPRTNPVCNVIRYKPARRASRGDPTFVTYYVTNWIADVG